MIKGACDVLRQLFGLKDVFGSRSGCVMASGK